MLGVEQDYFRFQPREEFSTEFVIGRSIVNPPFTLTVDSRHNTRWTIIACAGQNAKRKIFREFRRRGLWAVDRGL